MQSYCVAVIALLLVGFINADVIEKNISNGNKVRTRFSCRGRSNGYYADVESGCQTYHLCDVQGRQFTYNCPNATLFQQRMLICDHWYMVNCSLSEKLYAYNRLTYKADDSPSLEKISNVLDETNFENLETQETRNVASQNLQQDIDPMEAAMFSGDQETVKRSERRDLNVNVPATSIEPPNLPSQLNQKSINLGKSKTSTINNQFVTQQRKLQPQTNAQTTKKPVVRTFDPDKNYKAFEHIFQPGKKATHKDYDFSRYFTKRISGQATSAPVQRRQDTIQRSKSNPSEILKVRTNLERFNQQSVKKATIPTIRSFSSTTTTRQVYRPTTTVTTTTKKPFVGTATAPKSIFSQVNTVSKNFQQSGKINSNVKVPERGLLPPKLDNESEIQSKHNTRSIADTTFDFNKTQRRSGTGSKQLLNGNTKRIEYKDLQKLFSIPTYEFPIELHGRDGYENAEAVNSFQVKIPYKKGNRERYYYLEHEHCNPECHPYFFRPRSCEPCVKL